MIIDETCLVAIQLPVQIINLKNFELLTLKLYYSSLSKKWVCGFWGDVFGRFGGGFWKMFGRCFGRFGRHIGEVARGYLGGFWKSCEELFRYKKTIRNLLKTQKSNLLFSGE